MFALDVTKIFLFAVSIDTLWVLYILTVAEHRKIKASVISMLMGAPGLLGFLDIVADHALAIPYLIGLGVGTYIGSTIHDKIEKKKEKTVAYSEKVLDHFENPRNVGSLDKDDESVGTGLVGAPACGDVMKLQIQVNDEGIIEDAKFKTFGCGSAVAASSLITEMIKGKHLEDAVEIKNVDIVEELNLPPVKIHCSVLAEDAVKAAISDYKNKKSKKLPIVE